MGYVGLSNSVLLAQHHAVTAVDVVPEKVDMLNRRQSPIIDELLQDYLANKPLDFRATLDGAEAYADAAFVVIATPTDYDTQTGVFNTASIEKVIDEVRRINPSATIVIKSTIPRRLHGRAAPALRHRCHHVLARIPTRGLGALRQPAPLAHRGRGNRSCRRNFCRADAGRRDQDGHPDPVHRLDRSRSDQAVRQYLSRHARRLFQRTRHLCRKPRARQSADH